MRPKSPASTWALNGSASESMYESDTTAGTLQNDEEQDYKLSNQQGHLTEQAISIREHLPSQENQVCPIGENSEEYPWADKDRSVPPKSSLRTSLQMYLSDPDHHKQFFVTGEATRKMDISERHESISSPGKHRTDENEVDRNTAKRAKGSKIGGSTDKFGEKRNNLNTFDERRNSKGGKSKKHRTGSVLSLAEDI